MELVYRHRPGSCCPHDEPCNSPLNGPPPDGGYPGQRPAIFGAPRGRAREFGEGRTATRRNNRSRRWDRIMAAALLAAVGWYGWHTWQHAGDGTVRQHRGGQLVVRLDSGAERAVPVGADTARACRVGARWPDCRPAGSLR